MISIYLRPDETQVVEAEVKKDKCLYITRTFETDSFYDGILRPGDKGYADEETCEAEITHMFTALSRNFRVRSEDVYIVLPDYLFSAVECYEFISDENVLSEVEKTTGEAIDAFYTAFPVMTNPPAPSKKTVYAIRKQVIDRIVKVAMNLRIAIVSIEPASMGYFRAIADWSLDHPLVEIFDDFASIVTYSPAGGIFRHDTPELCLKNLREKTLQANEIVSSAYAMNNFASSEAFTHMRTDQEFVVLCNDKKVLDYPAIRLHLPQTPFTFKDYVIHDFRKEEQAQWMPVVGTLLTAFDAVYADGQENPVFTDLPIFVKISSCNLLPKEAQEMSRSRQWQQIVKRVGKYVIAACVVSMMAEGGAAFYFNSAEISPKLQQEYDAINSRKDEIEGEMAVIKSYKQEDFGILSAYNDILNARPQDCGFTDITIGSNNPTAQAKLKFVKVNAVAKNEMSFQDFRSKLETMESLQAPTVTSIKGDDSGYQNATIEIQKNGAKAKVAAPAKPAGEGEKEAKKK